MAEWRSEVYSTVDQFYLKLWVAKALMIFGVDSVKPQTSKKPVIFSLFGIFKSWVGRAKFTTRNLGEKKKTHTKAMRTSVQIKLYQSR